MQCGVLAVVLMLMISGSLTAVTAMLVWSGLVSILVLHRKYLGFGIKHVH